MTSVRLPGDSGIYCSYSHQQSVVYEEFNSASNSHSLRRPPRKKREFKAKYSIFYPGMLVGLADISPSICDGSLAGLVRGRIKFCIEWS